MLNDGAGIEWIHGVSSLPTSDLDVGVSHDGRGEKDNVARLHSDDPFCLVEYEVAALFAIEAPCAKVGTDRGKVILLVAVVVADSLRTEV